MIMGDWINLGERLHNLKDIREITIRENKEKSKWEILAIPFIADRNFEKDMKKAPLMSFERREEAQVVLERIMKELGIK